MNLLHMKYALEVAKAGSINKAAEVLMVAAPNVSRSIKELETDFGITIFERTQNGTKLTPEGEEFINYAKGVLRQIDEIERFYKTYSDHPFAPILNLLHHAHCKIHNHHMTTSL